VNFFIDKILYQLKNEFLFFFEFFAEKSIDVKPTKFLDVAGI